MINISQDEMTQAGFVQPNSDGNVVTQPTQTVQMPVVNSGTNISSTTVINGNDNKVNVFSSMIQDNTGGVSSIRILMLLWGCGVFIIWLLAYIVGICHGVYTIPSLPQEIVEILIGIVGIKTVQRFGEK